MADMEKVLEAVEEMEFRCDDCNGDGKEFEIGFMSDAGEDFFFTINTDGTPESFAREVRDYADDFDADEHAGMMYEAGQNGLSGVPSLSVLIRDAASIQEYLNNLADKVDAAIA